MTVEDMFLDLSEFNEIYIVEVGKPPKLVSKDDLERKTAAYDDPEGRYRTSGPKRLLRGKRARLVQYDFEKAPVSTYGAGYGILHYLVKSKENTEKGSHRGYIVYYKSNHRIKHMYCDCSDWFFRDWAGMVKAGLSTWDIDSRYKKFGPRDKKTGKLLVHNRKWTNETNPDGKIFICKHLFRAINDVFDKDMFDKLLDTDEKQTKEEKKIRKGIEKDLGAREPDKVPEPVAKKKPAVVKPVKEVPKPEEKPEEVPEKVVPVKKEVPKKVVKVPDVEKKIDELPSKVKKPEEIVPKKKPDVKKPIEDLKKDKSSFEDEYDEEEKKNNK